MIEIHNAQDKCVICNGSKRISIATDEPNNRDSPVHSDCPMCGGAEIDPVEVNFDKDTDVLHLRLLDQPVEDTVQLPTGVMIDCAVDGRIVAFEILDASRTLADSDLKKLALEVA